MPENSGKKRFIKDFLQRVKAGEGFIEDIWIERTVRLPGSIGEGSTARSLSGRPVSSITELLEDDLQHCFDEGYFTFRFVAALVGSGKTSLLTYLHELTKTKSVYERLSVVSYFQLSDLLTAGGSQSFSQRLYSYILAQTFWGLLNNQNPSIRDKAKSILSEYLDNNDVNQLIVITKFSPFRSKLSTYFAKSEILFEKLFLDIINEISGIEPQFTFSYIIDELDALEKYPDKLQETRSLFKALIKSATKEFSSKVRLHIYLAGTSNNIESFITEDSVIESLVGNFVINLNKGYSNEFETIRKKIDERIEGAFKGYKYFNEAWKEIKSISLNPAQNLRKFCQEYATAVLEVHEKYFKEEDEKRFEGNARDLVEAKCKQNWQTYLSKKSYTLSSVSTTTTLSGHAFDCYVELLHNGTCVARCFGEAKNYELLSSHLETFTQWLEDVKFKAFTVDGTPSDLAFMIAPSCPSLLQRKLELKNIEFISSPKMAPRPQIVSGKPGNATSESIDAQEKKTISIATPAISKPAVVVPLQGVQATNINTADLASLKSAFQGTRVSSDATFKKLIKNRPYTDPIDLATKMQFSSAVKSKLQVKFKKGEISFDFNRD